MAVGTHRGSVQVWDVAASKRVNNLEGHSARVGALAWNGDMLSSGSRDRLILQRDIRTPSIAPERRLVSACKKNQMEGLILQKCCVVT